ncbi:unnamed protein product [Urochloa humidicola]
MELYQQYIRPYVASLLALEDDQVIQISKDSGGSRVLEAFLGSSATAKRKFKVFGKFNASLKELRNRFRISPCKWRTWKSCNI